MKVLMKNGMSYSRIHMMKFDGGVVSLYGEMNVIYEVSPMQLQEVFE